MESIPIWRKYVLTIEEAAKYFHVGENKLRKLINENRLEKFILWNGTHALIKRNLFEKYIDELDCL